MMRWDPNYKNQGASPWGGDTSPAGTWGWNAERDEVIVGFDRNDLDVVTYDEARTMLSETARVVAAMAPRLELSPEEVVFLVRKALMVRVGAVINEAVADERARNIANALIGVAVTY
jgi:hypothetical protein